jgi:hypothetical protein
MDKITSILGNICFVQPTSCQKERSLDLEIFGKLSQEEITT